MSDTEKIIPCEFGEGPYYALNKKTVRKQILNSEHYGIYATDFIQEGEVCWKHFHSKVQISFNKQLTTPLTWKFQKLKKCQKNKEIGSFNIHTKSQMK
jgi:hypothetical protein